MTTYRFIQRCTVRSAPDGAQLIRLDPLKEDGSPRVITGWEAQPGYIKAGCLLMERTV